MKDALVKALVPMTAEDARTDRILAQSFFLTRPLQAGSVATIIRLDDRRPARAPSSR